MEINLHENDYSELRERMDKDYRLAMLMDTVLADPDTKKKYDFSVVLNDAQTFMERCVAILGADKIGYEITGGDRKQKLDVAVAHELEEVYKYWLYINDQQLKLRGQSRLMSDGNWYNLYRGWMGSLWLMYKVGDKFMPSIVPSDARGMTWEFDSKGLKQFSYYTPMERYAAEEKFKDSPGVKVLQALPKEKKISDIRCIWNRTHELVFPASFDSTGVGVKGEYLKSKEHELGVCPGVITFSPGQPAGMVGPDSYPTRFSRQGESIMAPNRRIYPMLDRVASILASIMQSGWKANVILKSDNKEGFDKDPFGPGKLPQIGKDDDMMLMPFRDLSQALQYFSGLLTSNKQKGGLSDINYGQIQFQVASLVVAQLKDDRDGIFVPRRTQNKDHYSQGFELFRQMVKNDKYYKVDESVINPEDCIDIDPKLFKDKFVININYTSISPEENISNYTIAGQAKSLGIPKKKILRDILHDDDPDGTLRESELEAQEELAPLLKLYRGAIALDPGRLTQAEIDADELLIMKDAIVQQMQANAQGGQPQLNLPGTASLPKLNLEKASPEKIAQKRANQSGQMDTINAQRAGGQ